MLIKKAWITQQKNDKGNPIDMAMLSIESLEPKIDYKRVSVSDRLFPTEPTEKHPLRHVVMLGPIEIDDLYLLQEEIANFLNTLE